LEVFTSQRNGQKQRFSLTALRMNQQQGIVFLIVLIPGIEDSSIQAPAVHPGELPVNGLYKSGIADALRESDARFQALAENTPAAVFIYQGRSVLFANRAAERTTGYSREEMYGREFWREMTQASEHSSDIAIKGAPQAVELQKGDVQSQASQDQVSQNQVFQNSHLPNLKFHDVNFIIQYFNN